MRRPRSADPDSEAPVSGAARRAVFRWRRWLLGTIAGILILVTVAVLGIAWYFSGVAIAVGSHSPQRGITAAAEGDGAVRLSRNSDSLHPGQYGIEWDGGYGQVGAILRADGTSVTRSFTPLRGTLPATTRAGLDSYAYTGDPRTALELAFEEVSVPGPLGQLPTWYVPADATQPPPGTWALFIHGHDGSRGEALRYLTTLHQLGMPVVVPSYRNDLGAPGSPDGYDHLGGTEWQDVDAALSWALAHGARDVILFGWSMGGAIALQTADRSAHAAAVRGLVLDAPVLDWRDVFTHQGGDRGLPGPLTTVAAWVIERRLDFDLDRFDWVARAKELRPQTLVFHSPSDSYVPQRSSAALARARPELVTLVATPGADHTREWNVDPAAFDAALRAWLVRFTG
jgi:pimeloyl-ACP methyl ester carboxylesterase